ncbi:MAG: hypothetical protein WCQ48_06885 [Chloroflexota bacterium]
MPPKTGITHLDAIIAAVIAGDATKLEPYVTGAVMGCLSQEVQCPAGIPLYTPVPALESDTCPGEGSWVRLSDVAEPNTTSAHEQAGRLANQQLRYLQAVYQIALGTWRDDLGIRYEIVLQRQRTDVAGVYLGVTERGIAQVIGWRGGLCGVSHSVLIPPP